MMNDPSARSGRGRGRGRRPPVTSDSASSSSSSTIPTLIDFSELEQVEDNIGSGVEGKVHKVRHVPTGKLYAVKENHDEDTGGARISQELDVFVNVEHPNIIKYHGFIFKDRGGIKLLLDYMDYGSLHGKRIPDEASLSAITRQILSAINHLHNKCNLVHLDINPSNLLINSEGLVKIADFGLSQFLGVEHEMCYPLPGTLAYMSRERVDLNRVGVSMRNAYAADIWSFGLSIWEIYLGRYPLNGGLPAHLTALNMAIYESLPPQLPPPASEDLRDFMARCLEVDPEKRWKAEQLMEHDFIVKHKSSEITHFGNSN